ncbi:MAG: hypothetical protein ACXQS8_00800, partial [Candidatus Helarchaeales archaeon]
SARPTVEVNNSDTTMYIQTEDAYYEVNSTHRLVKRVNETLNVTVVISDYDHDKKYTNDSVEFTVKIALKAKNQDYWINQSMDLLQSIEQYASDLNNEWYHGRSLWNWSYNFTGNDPVGAYDIYVDVLSYDQEGLTSRSCALQGSQYIGFIYVGNWGPEVESFNVESTTLHRINDTLTLNATFWDIDDIIASMNTSLKVDGNGSINQTALGTFQGTYLDVLYDDGKYHVAQNDSNGHVVMPYYVNLTNYGFSKDGVGGITITLQAKLSQTTNVTLAGWKIMNWSTGQPALLNDSIFNSTTDVNATFYFGPSEVSNIINQAENNRIEIFFVANTTGQSITGYVDYINIDVLDYNKTGIRATACLYNVEHQKWVNLTMKYLTDVGGQKYNTSNWSLSYSFSSLDRAGTWLIYFYLEDRENETYLYNTTTTLTVLNHIPNVVEIYQPVDSVYRLQNMTFIANASDIDVFSKQDNLTVNASLYCYANSQWYNISMNYNASSQSWYLIWAPSANYLTGNWSYYVTVEDEEGGINETTISYNFTVLNNHPTITELMLYPENHEFFEGMTLKLQFSFSDVEGLKEYYIFISDGINTVEMAHISLTGNDSTIYHEFPETSLENLTYSTGGQWHVIIMLVDSDDVSTNYTFQLSVTPRPPPPPTFRFPIEIVVIFGIIIIVVVGAFLIYRFSHKEEPAVPASRVKSIIKQLSEQRREEELREQKLIEERIKKEREKLLKKPKETVEKAKPKRKEVAERRPLSKLERKNLEIQLSNLLGDARFEIRKNNFLKAGQLYKKAAKIASQLGDTEKVKRFSEQADYYLRKAKKK